MKAERHGHGAAATDRNADVRRKLHGVLRKVRQADRLAEEVELDPKEIALLTHTLHGVVRVLDAIQDLLDGDDSEAKYLWLEMEVRRRTLAELDELYRTMS